MITLGLQRITQLLSPLLNAHPSLPWKAVHIAGTNGKGSVAALVSTFLGHLGYRVGRFTSPHIIDRWDCITIDRTVVDRAKYLLIEQQFRDRSLKENIGASEFEILTASAFQLFTNEKVDVAVIECGLGGREDATNVLRPGDVILSVITKVGLDHTEFLGDTIEAIAAEKAGIFKPGVPVVVDQSNEKSVLEVVAKQLKKLGWERDGQAGVYLSLEERRGELDSVIRQLRMASHQAQNLYTAWSAFRHAENSLGVRHSGKQPPPRSEPQLGPATTASSLAKAENDRMISGVVPSQPISTIASLERLILEAQSSLPGRLQWLTLPRGLLPQDIADPPIDTRVLLDGAHNAQSAAALVEFVDHNVRSDHSTMQPDQSKPVTWLLAVKKDKDVNRILSVLLKPHDNVITCAFGPVDGMPWVKPMPASDLAARASKLTDGVVKALPDEGTIPDDNNHGDLHNAYIAKAVQEAVRTAAAAAAADGRDCHRRLCITGSLYLVGDVLRCVRDAGGSIYGNQ
ncbi:dihydrofolate synthetase Fol3 [Cladophialophora carrionii]|uniref:Dihydrofolate synthetase Fol3 n=1 Tax=Cladophialophora carrionii TaxID=86049 RepID=A0A1C1CSQ8_9EURO|nr:dihydrofolate synthetase Fol3 [Cladophialophora carrionii]